MITNIVISGEFNEIKKTKILNNPDIKSLILEKAKILKIAVPIGISEQGIKYCNWVNERLNKCDEMIMYIIDSIKGEDFE